MCVASLRCASKYGFLQRWSRKPTLEVVMKRRMGSKAQQGVMWKDARREGKQKASPKRGLALEVRGGRRRSPLTQTTREKEKAALEKVTEFTFHVVPFKVKVGGTVTATWDVTIPSIDETGGFEIFITLNGEPVPASGSKSFKVDQNTAFRLVAVIDQPLVVSRILKQEIVTVDLSDCRSLPFPASVLTVPVKNAVDAAFSGNGQFQFRDPAGTQLTVGNASLDIRVPLTLDVPDWFDADMDIHVQLTIGGRDGVVIVAAPVVEATVDWSLLSDILSGGCTVAVATGMSKLAQVFLQEIVDAQIQPFVKGILEGVVSEAVASAQAQDPAHRPYAMTQMIFSQFSGILITACPQ